MIDLDRRTLLAGGGVAALAIATPWLSAPVGSAPADQIAMLDAISETLIPGSAATAPGAYLASVLPNRFLGLAIDDVQIVGLALGRIAQGDFVALASDRRGAALARLDSEAFAATVDAPIATAWKTLKLALVSVYYTSEQGAAHDLIYDLVPGRWEPDIPLSARPRQLSNDSMARLFT